MVLCDLKFKRNVLIFHSQQLQQRHFLRFLYFESRLSWFGSAAKLNFCWLAHSCWLHHNLYLHWKICSILNVYFGVLGWKPLCLAMKCWCTEMICVLRYTYISKRERTRTKSYIVVNTKDGRHLKCSEKQYAVQFKSHDN